MKHKYNHESITLVNFQDVYETVCLPGMKKDLRTQLEIISAGISFLHKYYTWSTNGMIWRGYKINLMVHKMIQKKKERSL